jgi:chloramphenicol-sensitive protein RarD
VTDTDESADLRRGVLAGASAYVIWGLLTIYWKQLRDFNAFELIGWRIIWSAIVMAITLSAMHRWSIVAEVLRDRRLLGRVTLTGMVLTVNWTVYVWAVVHGNVIETALGYFIAPLGTMAVGVVVLHERLRTAQRIAITFAIAAIVVITASYGRVPWLALVIAATWTVYAYLKKQVPLTAVDSMAAETFVMLAPAITVAAVFAARATSVPSSATTSELLLVACSGLATVVPLTLFAFASRRVPLSVLGPMQYVVPTTNFLLGWLAYHEDLPRERVVGFVLVWVGLLLASIDTARRATSARRKLNAMRVLSDTHR